jgi:ribosomal protein S18 acetylase RimI-like enzyme
LPAIERIAGTSFAFGRYHGDGRFSRVLADRRYQVWARRAVLEASDSEPMLVLDGPAGVAAFMQVAIADGSAVLKLAAVDTSTEHGLLGYQLYVSTLALLQDRGCAEVTARISAANTAVLNLYAGLGFQFGRAETILHLHP